MNYDGVDLDAALKEYYLDRVEEKFIPRHDKPVIKHPLNDYDYEGVVDAIKEHWLNMGCQTNNEDCSLCYFVIPSRYRRYMNIIYMLCFVNSKWQHLCCVQAVDTGLMNVGAGQCHKAYFDSGVF